MNELEVPFWLHAMRDAYASSEHEPTLLKVRNIDPFAKAMWNGRQIHEPPPCRICEGYCGGFVS